MATFKAIRIDKADKGTTAALTQFDEAELMEIGRASCRERV